MAENFDQIALDAWRARLDDHVASGAVPGLVALACRGDAVEVHTAGCLAIGGPPMARGTIFRIASMTKPVAAVAAMILVEDGVFTLDTPVEHWLPELAARRVLRRLDGPLEDTVPAGRAITVRDLLTLRMGLGIIMTDTRGWPIQEAFNRLGILQGPPHPAATTDPDTWMAGLGSLPLVHSPGEGWLYDLGLDVLGVLVARASGRDLGDFMQARIFEPLGMGDTGFWVPGEKLHQLSSSYETDPATGALRIYDRAADSEWSSPPPFPSGGGGLVSTVDDYLAFARMLLKGGLGDGVRLLRAESVAEMTRDHITAEQRRANPFFFNEHTSWGLGMSVDLSRGAIYEQPGRFGWDGGLGTSARVDPDNGIIGVLLTNRNMDSPEPPAVFTDFWTGLYRAGLD